MTVTANAAFVRYETGYVYLNYAPPGTRAKEVFLELGGVYDRSTAIGIANEMIRVNGTDRETVALSGVVYDPSQIPEVAYRIGDKMDGKMILGLSMKQADEGYFQVTPELNEPIAVREASLERRIARFSSGITPEFGRPTIEIQETGRATDSTPPPFSQDGAVIVSLSPPWECPRPFHISWLEASLGVSGSTATVCILYVSTTGSGFDYEPFGTVTVAEGETRGIEFNNRHIEAGWRVAVACDEAGANAQKLTISLRGVMV